MNRKKLSMLWQLYWIFFRIGGFTFGGGLTMLPTLQYELVQKRNWVTEEELLDCYAIGQCTPGIIAVNTATFVGYKKEKVAGGIWATLGMISPSILIITVVAMFLRQFMDNIWLQHALMGIRGVVCALMINTVFTLGKKSLINWRAWALAIAIFVLAVFTNVPNVVLVIIAAAEGILLDRYDKRQKDTGSVKGKEKEEK